MHKPSLFEFCSWVWVGKALGAIIFLSSALFLLVGCGNSVPIAVFTASLSTGVAPLTVEFDASVSLDPDGTIISYQWDFGDGNLGSGPQTVHTFQNAGTYKVKLIVIDNKGASDSDTLSIQVTPPANVIPVASFIAMPTSGIRPLAVSFDASASVDSDGVIITYTWDFGDGVSGFGMMVSHTYTSSGTYTVTLTVTDNEGAADDKTTLITVSEPPRPVARFTATSTAGPVPLTVEFDAGASYHEDAEKNIASYRWSFGDGGSEAAETVIHVYESARTYTVTLTVADEDGVEDVATQTIQVSGPEFLELGDSVCNGEIRLTLRAVRSASAIGVWEPDPEHIYVIVDLRADGIKDGQLIWIDDFKIVCGDSEVRVTKDIATFSLDHYFKGGNLDAGQFVDGELAFEVRTADFYILEYTQWGEEPLKFRLLP